MNATKPNFAQRWNTFWFEPTSPVGMALFRIVFGIILLEDMLIHILPDFDLFYTKNSLVPISDMISLYWHNDRLFDALLLLPPDDKYILGAFWVMVTATVFMTIGFFTRTSSWIAFLLLMSFSSHFELNQNAGDNYLRIVTMCVALSNAGDALSIDSLLKSLRTDWRVTGLGPRISAPWAQRLIQLQICIAYFHTWVCKMEGETWNNGVAVYYAVRYDDIIRFPLPHFFDQLPVYFVLTWFTLVIEFALWNFIWWRPTRYWVLLAGLALHLGIEYCMNLPMFEWAFIFTYILFIYPEDLTRIWNRLKAELVRRFGEPYKLAFNGSCLLCVRLVGLIHRLDIFGRIQPVDINDKDATQILTGLPQDQAQQKLMVKDGKGNWLSGFPAFSFMTLRMPLLWPAAPVLGLPVLNLIGQMIYGLLMSTRKFIMGSSEHAVAIRSEAPTT
jgi:predicted DCC family thiol-disulfide oxidoreductase YuxK